MKRDLLGECRNCKFWDEEGAKAKGQGICRRSPPNAMAMLVPTQNVMRAQQELQVQVHTCWPTTAEKAVCGDWVGSTTAKQLGNLLNG